MKIKPCPFCGGPAEVKANEEWTDCAKRPSIYYGIGCHTENCWCQMSVDEFCFTNESDAIDLWNRRKNSIEQAVEADAEKCSYAGIGDLNCTCRACLSRDFNRTA